MISSNQASKLIKNNLRKLKSKKINAMDSVGSILREDISAERNQPPFDRVTMDGIAINYSKTKMQCFYPIQSTHFAGDAPKKLIKKNQCIEVMTGSVLPANTNCVIPIECVKIENQNAIIETLNLKLKGDEILYKSQKISVTRLIETQNDLNNANNILLDLVTQKKYYLMDILILNNDLAKITNGLG